MSNPKLTFLHEERQIKEYTVKHPTSYGRLSAIPESTKNTLHDLYMTCMVFMHTFDTNFIEFAAIWQNALKEIHLAGQTQNVYFYLELLGKAVGFEPKLIDAVIEQIDNE